MPTLVVPASIDSCMSGVQRSLNFGAAPYVTHDVLYGGGAKLQWRRAIVDFDVSLLAGATVGGAKLVRELQNVVNGGQQAILSRCTRPAEWVELEVTWDQYRVGGPWTNGGGDYDDAGPPAALTYTEPFDTGEHEIPGLEAFVVDALDNRDGIVSLITRLGNEAPGATTQYGWHSRESGAQGWRLVIDYTPFVPPDPGRRSVRRPPRAAGARATRPAQVAGPATSVRPGRPHRPRRKA